MADALAQFTKLKSTSDFAFVVFFRGHWCPFCISYLKDLQSITNEIVAAGGIPIAITAENADKLPETRKRSGYQGEIIPDTKNALAKQMKSLNIAITSKSGYPDGVAQPGVLVMKKDGTVLYRWAIVPSLMNLNGATDRPSLLEIWSDVKEQLSGKEHQQPLDGKKYSTSRQSFTTVMKGKIFG